MSEMQPTMTEQEAIDVLRKYILDTGKTQTVVAKELNISSGALSSFLKGTYKAPHTVVPKVQELLHLSEKKKVAPRKPDYVETGISRTVLNAIRYSHIQGQVSVVYGDAGIGKTMAFRRYLEENSLAVGITISPTYSSITGVNELLAEQIGVRERVARRITREIVSKLRGSGRVVIIDEAQHLTTRTLNHLRCISDESGVGICLIGNLEVYTRMKGSGKADFAQLFSRIGMAKPLMTIDITRDDMDRIFGQHGIDSESLDMLYRICQTTYGLRGAVNVFVNTAAVFEQITAANVTKVMRDMNIGVSA